MSLRPDESWVAEATFLCRLAPDDRERLLSLSHRARLGAGEALLDGESLALLLRGEVEITRPGELTAHRGGPGRLFGAGLMMHEPVAEVIAATPVEILRFPVEALRSLDQGWTLRDLIVSIAELDHQLPQLDELLRREPTLRLFNPDQRAVLLQCSRVVDHPAGATLLEAKDRSEQLVLLLRGHARLLDPSSSGRKDPRRLAQLLPEGLMVGAQDLAGDDPPVQPYQVEAATAARVLEIPWRALRHHAQRSRAIRARIQPADPRGQRGQAHVVLGAEPGLGTRALCLGTAIALQDYEQDVALLDLDGAETAGRLGLVSEAVVLDGVDARRASLGGSMPWLYWPLHRSDAEALFEGLVVRHSQLIVHMGPEVAPPSSFLDRFVNVVRLYASPQQRFAFPVSRHQRLIHALRLPAEGFPSRPTRPFQGTPGPESRMVLRQMLRVPWDPVVAEVYTGQRVVRQLGIGETPFGRASCRLARMLLGRAVGLALGGGGAWGFAHLGLLRALHDENVPIDYIAGTSFGAVVGAAFAARGMAGLDDLERYAWTMPVIATTCVFRTTALGLLIDRIAGPVHHLDTEVPMLAVAADVRTAAPYVLPAGTLADAVRASSGFPGLFAHYQYQERRLVDGGVAANVPAEMVHEAGADFILASNCIPRFMDETPMLSSAPVVDRVIDLVRSTMALMHRSSSRDASLADHIFHARVGDYSPHQFRKGPEIAKRAYEQARVEIPAIRAAYEADLSTHVAAR